MPAILLLWVRKSTYCRPQLLAALTKTVSKYVYRDLPISIDADISIQIPRWPSEVGSRDYICMYMYMYSGAA